jgi:hypothetical protein
MFGGNILTLSLSASFHCVEENMVEVNCSENLPPGWIAGVQGSEVEFLVFYTNGNQPFILGIIISRGC